MSTNNHSQFIGFLGQDPEMKTLESGKKVASFSVATNEYYKDKITGEKKTVTEWHNIVAYNSLAEIVEKYLKKGTEILVAGKHKTDTYEDKDKVKRYRSYFVAGEIRFFGKAKEEVVLASQEEDQPF